MRLFIKKEGYILDDKPIIDGSGELQHKLVLKFYIDGEDVTDEYIIHTVNEVDFKENYKIFYGWMEYKRESYDRRYIKELLWHNGIDLTVFTSLDKENFYHCNIVVPKKYLKIDGYKIELDENIEEENEDNLVWVNNMNKERKTLRTLIEERMEKERMEKEATKEEDDLEYLNDEDHMVATVENKDVYCKVIFNKDGKIYRIEIKNLRNKDYLTEEQLNLVVKFKNTIRDSDWKREDECY